MTNKSTKILLAASVVSAALMGCGSESNSVATDPIVITSVNGIASHGGAIKGNVTVRDAQPTSAFIANTSVSLPVSNLGKFTIQGADELNYPVLLKVEGSHGVSRSTEYALLLDNRNERINISPLTRLLISRITGVDAEQVFNDFPQYQSSFTVENIEEAQQELRSVISPLLIAANVPEDVDILTSTYDANFTGLDSVLSTLDVEYSSGKAILTYIPTKKYSVELPYDSDWQNRTLIPTSEDDKKLSQELSVIYKADKLLESMILLKDNKDDFDNMLASAAHWFGSSAENMHKSFFDILPAEKDTTLNRYRDLVILDSQSEKQRYLLGFTTAFENSKTSSVARDQAWFEFNDSGELKFLGDDQPFPTSFYALYKVNFAPADYNWSSNESFYWVFEATGFLSSTDCTENLDRGVWDGWNLNPEHKKAFFDSLPGLGGLDTGLEYISVTSPANVEIKLDKIFRDPSDFSCHLVDSKNQLSPVYDGYILNLESNAIQENSEYTVTYVYSDPSNNLSKTIKLTRPPENKAKTSEFLATLVSVNGAKGEFFYDWERENRFVAEGDLYVMFPDHVGAGYRVNVEDGKTEVSSNLDKDVARIHQSAFDPYGRVILNYYISQNDGALE